MAPASMSLRAAIGTTPLTRPLKDGAITPDLFALDFAGITPINRAFAPMVRDQSFDISEIAIATYLQAKAYGKPLVLLPVTLAARFQEQALLCRADSAIRSPADLNGCRVGVRAYSQTTGLWLRGILADDYGFRASDIAWVTFEGAHVLEYQDPPFVKRAAAGQDMLAMLRNGELDAVIAGNEVPGDPGLRTVFPDPAAAGRVFWGKHGFAPVNHMLCVTQSLAETRPDLMLDLYALFSRAKAAHDATRTAGSPDLYPLGRAAVAPAVVRALRHAMDQGLLPRELALDRLWDALPEALI